MRTRSIQCACGRQLKIVEGSTDPVRCPDCGKTYRLRRHRHPPLQTDAGRPAPAASEPTPVELDLTAAPSPTPGPSADFVPSVVVIEPEESLGYAAPDKVWSALPAETEGGDDDACLQSFHRDAIRSFLYPLRPSENLVVFVISALVGLLIPLLEQVMTLPHINLYRPAGLAIAAYAVVFGYLAALYMSIVQETAMGSSDMPSLKMENGILDDLIVPLFRYVGSFAVALLPATLYMFSRGLGAPLPIQGRIPLLAAGVFLWPMILLLFATESLSVLYRLDLIFKTIARTFQAYFTLGLLLSALGVLVSFAAPGLLVKLVGIPLGRLNLAQPGLAGKLGLCIAQTYLTIVAMRLIGLYYWHFKRRFAIVLE